MRIVAIVQARLNSTRLPRKVLADMGGTRLLDVLVERLLRAEGLDAVWLAIPTGDLALWDAVPGWGISAACGSEEDVLGRYVVAAQASKADAVVRITADCPLLDPQLVSAAVIRYRRRARRHLHTDYLYVQGYPRGTGEVEIVSRQALEQTARETEDPWHREHVVTYLLAHPERFAVVVGQAPRRFRRPDLRLCVDEPADLEVVRWLVAHVPPPRGVKQLIKALDAHPEIAALNAQVQQRS